MPLLGLRSFVLKIFNMFFDFSGESKDAEDFRIKFAQKTAEYVEETLNPHFGDLISFCSEAEALIEKG